MLAEMPGLVLDGQTSGPTPERGRLLAAGRPVALRLGPGPALAGARLARALRRF